MSGNSIKTKFQARGLIFILTNECNCRCIMCDYWKSKVHPSLNSNDLMLFWQKNIKYKPFFLTLSGGEPLLYKDFMKLTKFFNNKVENLVLSTNGILLESFANEIISYFNKIIVSFDGSKAETLKAIRGLDIFDTVLNACHKIRHLSKEPRIIMKFVIQRRNFREISDFINLAYESGVSGVAFAVPDFTSNAFNFSYERVHEKKQKCMLNKTESHEFENVVREVYTNHKHIIDSGFVTEGNLFKFIHYFYYHSGVETELRPQTCKVKGNRLIVNYNGDIKTCFFWDPITNINLLRQSKYRLQEENLYFYRKSYGSAKKMCQMCYQFSDWKF
jgi:MoaA/NifB/PqqE/SkfB family radical SAM enzyme